MRAGPLLGAALACATGLTCRVARADVDEDVRPAEREPTPSGPRLALRSGLALPFGSAFITSGPLSATIKGYVPLRVDAGYRIARHFYLGVNAQLAAIVPNACSSSGASCSGTNVRVGFMAAFHLLPGALVDPWLGLGMGYERLGVSRTIDDTTSEISARGFELLDVDLGVDLRPTRSLRLGPVVSASVAQYTRIAINGASTSDFDPVPHVWLLVGFRGAYDL